MNKHDLTAQLGLQLKQMRKSRGLSQVILAKVTKVSQPAISKIESGRAVPSLQHAAAVAKYFKRPFTVTADGHCKGWAE